MAYRMNIITEFKKNAKSLGRNPNSMSEFKLWVLAHKSVEFNKIFKENNGFKSRDVYVTIETLRSVYGLDDMEIHNFLKTYILNPDPELNASMDLDRTDAKPGASYEEFNESLVGLG